MKSPLLLLVVALALAFLAQAFWPDDSQDPDRSSPQETQTSQESDADDEQEDRTHSDEASSEEAQAEEARTASSTRVEASVVSEEGVALSGTAYWVELNEELIEELSNDVTIPPATIWQLGKLQEHPFVNGDLALELPSETPLFFWLECPGYHTRHWFLAEATVPDSIALQACASFEIELVQDQGLPITQASVVIFHDGADKSLINADWKARLIKRYFQQSAEPDHEGLCRFDILPDEKVSVWAKPEGAFGNVTRDSVQPEGRLRIEVRRAMTLTGSVRDMEGNPLPETYILCMQRLPGAQNRSAVGSTAADEEGNYRTEKVTVSGVGLHAVAFRPGYEMTVVPIPHPRVGTELRIDFKMRQADARKLRVLGPGGIALGGLIVEFARTEQDWLPFPAEVSNEGFAEVDPILVSGRDYILRAKSDGELVATQRFEAASPDEIQTVRLEGLSRLSPIGASDHVDETATFHSLAKDVGSITWVAGQASPWLPSGPGWLTLGDESHYLVLAPGKVDWPERRTSPRALRFSLSLLEGERVQASLTLGADLPRLALGEIRDGANDFELAPRARHLELQSNLRGTWAIPIPVTAGPEVHLGSLSWPQHASLQLQVLRDGDNPIPSTFVALRDGEGQIVASGLTDEQGKWSSPAITARPYTLVVSPALGHSAPVADQLLELHLTEPQQMEVVRFGGQGELLVQAPARGFGRWQAQIRDANGSIHEAVSNAKSAMTFQGLVGPIDWVAWKAAPAFLEAQAGSHANGTGILRLTQVAPTSIRMPSKEAGAVAVYLHGERRAIVPIDAGQDLQLSASRSDAIELAWIGVDGVGARVRAWEALITRQLPGVESESDFIVVRCEDETGSALGGVMALFERAPNATLFTVDGKARLESHHEGDRLRASIAGFHPGAVAVTEGSVLVLRRLTGAVEVAWPAGADRVAIVPHFELSVPLAVSSWERTASRTTAAGRLPAGSYQVQWLDESGALVRETTVDLVAREAREIRADG